MIKHRARTRLGIVLVICTVTSFLISVGAFLGITAASRHVMSTVVYKKEAIVQAEKQLLNSLVQHLNKERATILNEDAIQRWIRDKKDVMLAVFDPAEPYGRAGTAATLYSAVSDPLSMYRLLQDEYSDYWYSSAIALRGDRVRSRVVKILYFPMYRADMYVLYASGIVSFMLFVLIIFACIRRKTRYISLLSRELQAMEGGDLSLPVTIRGNDELTSLAIDMEEMRKSFIERLGREEEMTRRSSELLTAMSHDLRTPLTSLIGYLDIIDLGKCRDDEQMMKYVKSGKEKAYQIKEMTDKLFEYFLVYQSSDEPIEMEQIDAGMLFSQLWSESALILESDGYIISMTEPDREAMIHANISFIRRVMDNIVSNIRKYADKEEIVLVTMRRSDTHFIFETANTVGEMRQAAESSGIGLASCKKILESHKGTFTYLKRNGRFTVSMSIPIIDSEGADSIGQT